MTRRYTGGFLSSTEQATDANSANGIFTLSEAAEKTALGSFPTGRYSTGRSLRFRRSAGGYLSRTPTTNGSGSKLTWAGWVKRGIIGGSDYNVLYSAGSGDGTLSALYFGTDDKLNWLSYNGSYQWQVISTAVFRDPSAWYHIVAVLDTAQALSTNRIKIYVNNVQITSFGTASYPSQNYASPFYNQTSYAQFIGRWGTWNASHIYDGYLSDVYLIDGQALTPSSFGQTDAATNVWIPKPYTGTYGTNGFNLPFNVDTTFSADYLIVSGGGGGGGAVNDYTAGGGGGAGGMVTGTATAATGTAYTITVGAGATGGAYNALSTIGSSSVFSPSGITVYGGGPGGAIFSAAAGNGGSGGGGGTMISPTSYLGGKGVYPGSTYVSTTRQGYDGGDGQQHATGAGAKAGAGGGGAGGAGDSSTSTGGAGQAGGIGLASSISGSSVTYAGGGGGGGSASAGSGGSSIGGAGSVYNGNGGNGTANTGSGGGGAARNNSAGSQSGGNGGSGIVIIKIPSSRNAYFSSGVTSTLSTSVAGYKIYTVTATSTTSETVTFA